MTAFSHAAPHVLVISDYLDPARQRCLAELCGPSELRHARPGGSPSLGGVHGVILDGLTLGELDNPAVEVWARNGGSVVCLPGAAPDAPRAEWIATVAPAGHPATARFPREMAITDRLASSGPGAGAPGAGGPGGGGPGGGGPGGGVEVLVSLSVGFRDRPAVTCRRLGAGQVSTSALGSTPEALAHPDLALLLRRLLILGPAVTARPGPVGLGIIGYGPLGGMGQRHGLAAASTDGLELVAACDSDANRRKAAESDFAGLRAYSAIEDLLADDEVGVVIVATPPVSHGRIAQEALQAGKHLVLEKPMCLAHAQARALAAMAASRGLSLTVHQNRRWDPDYRAVRRVLDEGLLGELFSVETFVGGFEHPCRAWHSEESISGGAVYDWGSHYLDWAIQLMGGPPRTVSAHAHKRVWHDVTNADQVRVHLAWPDGREAVFVQSDVAAIRKPKLYLQGTTGTLAGYYRPVLSERVEPARGYVSELSHPAEAPVELTLARYQAGWGISETRLLPLPELAHPFHRNLADHLLLGEPLAVTPESVLPVIAVLEAATASAAHGGEPICLEG